MKFKCEYKNWILLASKFYDEFWHSAVLC